MPDSYGKSDAQILEMGEKRWDDFYQQKAGNSTPAMADMSTLYGGALHRRNDKLVRLRGEAMRLKVKKLRSLLADFGFAGVSIGRNIDGGGTMWTPVAAHVEVDIETLVFGILGSSQAPVKKLRVSNATTPLKLLEKQIEVTHADKDSASFFHYSIAREDLAKMKSDFNRLVEIAKTLSRPNSDRILGFCADYAKLAKADWS